jgi:NitT/TauT family transport system substrate-binding protein
MLRDASTVPTMSAFHAFGAALALACSTLMLGCQSQARTVPFKSAGSPGADPLKIAYSDWPGWIAWDIGIKKGWFREAGVAVDFRWFDYASSMDSFATGKVNAVSITLGDAFISGSMGRPSRCIVATDYSNGNDMIVARPGVKSVADLRRTSIGVEFGTLSHLLVLKALESASIPEPDVKLVNMPTDLLPEALKAGRVDAVAAWQPHSGIALKELPGSRPVFTTKNVPGLIFDVLCVDPKNLEERRADWTKVVEVWFRIAEFVNDPRNADAAAHIMGQRLELAGDQFKPFMEGTRFLGLADNAKAWSQTDGIDSVYGSSKLVDAFYRRQKMYQEQIHCADYLDGSIVAAITKANAGL